MYNITILKHNWTFIILDEMRIMKEQGIDPLKECLHDLDHSPSEDSANKRTKGLLLFLYGSPCEGNTNLTKSSHFQYKLPLYCL